MTRVVVQRGSGPSSSSQSRPASAPPSSSSTPPLPQPLPSSSSPPPGAPSCSIYGDDGVEQSGKEAQYHHLELETSLVDTSVKTSPLSCPTDRKASIAEQTGEGRVQGVATVEAVGDEDLLDRRRELDLASQLQHVLAERPADFYVQQAKEGDDLGMVTEIGLEGEGGNGIEKLNPENERIGFSLDDLSMQPKATGIDSILETKEEDAGNPTAFGLHRYPVSMQNSMQPLSQPTYSTMPLPSMSLPMVLPQSQTGSYTPPLPPTSSISSLPPPCETAPILRSHEENDQLRPTVIASVTEAVGCSYMSAPAPSVLFPSGSSRRVGWLGPSASSGTRGGGSTRRIPRAMKGSRNSPNSSRPTSPRAYGEGDGYNSADEQSPWAPGSSGYEDNLSLDCEKEEEEVECERDSNSYECGERERQFETELRRTRSLEVRRMAEDGNCLFRAVADQVYGDAEMYDETRQMCIDYMEKERDHFSQFVTESFTAYCKRKRRDKVYGNNLEIQAMAEMYNRPIHIYSYSSEPINIFHGSYETDLPPIRLSYHRGNHYNSLLDPCRPAVGAGLGFGSLRGRNVDTEQVKAALKAQQEQQIDKALLAEGRYYSDMELTEQEIERMVMEASRAEFLAGEDHRFHYPWHEETSTSAAAEPSSSGTTGSPRSTGDVLDLVQSGSRQTVARSVSLPATSGSVDPTLSSNVRMLLSMGFSYLRVTEAHTIFDDDVNNMLCYLLETETNMSSGGESMYRRKGKAAE